MRRGMEPSVFKMDTIDVFTVARLGAALEGEIGFAAMPRLAQILVRQEGTLRYRCRGRIDERGRPGLRLFLQAVLPLRCDRCGRQLDLEMAVEKIFFFVPTQAQLSALAIDDSPEEALLGSAHFDLAALIEDEAILQLPISPRHEDCAPDSRAAASATAAEQPHPFAQLAALRDRLQHSGPAATGAAANPATNPATQAAPALAARKPRRDAS